VPKRQVFAWQFAVLPYRDHHTPRPILQEKRLADVELNAGRLPSFAAVFRSGTLDPSRMVCARADFMFSYLVAAADDSHARSVTVGKLYLLLLCHPIAESLTNTTNKIYIIKIRWSLR